MGKELGEAFLPHPHAFDETRVDALSGALATAFERGRLMWPRFHVDPAEFAKHLGGLWAGDGSPVDWLAKRKIEGLYFALACLNRDPPALRALEQLVRTDMPKYVAHLSLSEADQDDVRQDLLLELLEHAPDKRHCLTEYKGLGPFEAYLRIIALRSAIDGQRRRTRRRETQDTEAPIRPDADLELSYIEIRYREAVREALNAALRDLKPEEKLLLRLYFFDGRRIDGLASFFNYDRSTAARRLAKIRSGVRSRLKERIRAQFGVDEDEVKDLLALLRSRLDISLSSVLRTEV